MISEFGWASIEVFAPVYDLLCELMALHGMAFSRHGDEWRIVMSDEVAKTPALKDFLVFKSREEPRSSPPKLKKRERATISLFHNRGPETETLPNHSPARRLVAPQVFAFRRGEARSRVVPRPADDLWLSQFLHEPGRLPQQRQDRVRALAMRVL